MGLRVSGGSVFIASTASPLVSGSVLGVRRTASGETGAEQLRPDACAVGFVRRADERESGAAVGMAGQRRASLPPR